MGLMTSHRIIILLHLMELDVSSHDRKPNSMSRYNVWTDQLRSKIDVVHVKMLILFFEFTVDVWYLGMVSGAKNEHQSRPPTIMYGQK
jgi:hypothetical protein